jgi:hypothetical protein
MSPFNRMGYTEITENHGGSKRIKEKREKKRAGIRCPLKAEQDFRPPFLEGL